MKESEIIRRIITGMVREFSGEDYFEELCWLFKRYDIALSSEEYDEEKKKHESD